MGLSADQIANAYHSLLGRNPDAAGAAWWQSQPDMNLSSLYSGISQSNEFGGLSGSAGYDPNAWGVNQGAEMGFAAGQKQAENSQFKQLQDMFGQMQQSQKDATATDPNTLQNQAYQKMQGGSFTGGLLNELYSNPYFGQVTGKKQDASGSFGSMGSVFGAKNPYSAV